MAAPKTFEQRSNLVAKRQAIFFTLCRFILTFAAFVLACLACTESWMACSDSDCAECLVKVYSSFCPGCSNCTNIWTDQAPKHSKAVKSTIILGLLFAVFSAGVTTFSFFRLWHKLHRLESELYFLVSRILAFVASCLFFSCFITVVAAKDKFSNVHISSSWELGFMYCTLSWAACLMSVFVCRRPHLIYDRSTAGAPRPIMEGGVSFTQADLELGISHSPTNDDLKSDLKKKKKSRAYSSVESLVVPTDGSQLKILFDKDGENILVEFSGLEEFSDFSRILIENELNPKGVEFYFLRKPNNEKYVVNNTSSLKLAFDEAKKNGGELKMIADKRKSAFGFGFLTNKIKESVETRISIKVVVAGEGGVSSKDYILPDIPTSFSIYQLLPEVSKVTQIPKHLIELSYAHKNGFQITQLTTNMAARTAMKDCTTDTVATFSLRKNENREKVIVYLYPDGKSKELFIDPSAVTMADLYLHAEELCEIKHPELSYIARHGKLAPIKEPSHLVAMMAARSLPINRSVPRMIVREGGAKGPVVRSNRSSEYVAAYEKKIHIILAYDRRSDMLVAENLANALQENIIVVKSTDVLNPHPPKNVRISCWMDLYEVKKPEDYMKEFNKGLAEALVFIPLLSHQCVNAFSRISPYDRVANPLLHQIELALERRKKKQVCVFPVFIGEQQGDKYLPFNDLQNLLSSFPTTPSHSYLDASVRETMEELLQLHSFVLETEEFEPLLRGIISHLQRKWDETFDKRISLATKEINVLAFKGGEEVHGDLAPSKFKESELIRMRASSDVWTRDNNEEDNQDDGNDVFSDSEASSPSSPTAPLPGHRVFFNTHTLASTLRHLEHGSTDDLTDGSPPQPERRDSVLSGLSADIEMPSRLPSFAHQIPEEKDVLY